MASLHAQERHSQSRFTHWITAYPQYAQNVQEEVDDVEVQLVARDDVVIGAQDVCDLPRVEDDEGAEEQRSEQRVPQYASALYPP